MTAPTEPLATRALAPGDAEAGFRLSAAAGWNQTADDWRCMIKHGAAWGQFTPAGRLVASTLIMPYGRLAWIAMVLTAQDFRGQGIATWNLGEAIRRCAARGLPAGLDATPEGRRVYAPQGFRAAGAIHRWLAQAPSPPGHAPAPLAIHPLRGPADLDRVSAQDGLVLGASRRPVLAHLQDSEPERALIAQSRGELRGFILARAGRAALHLGPLVAHDAPTAGALLAHALEGWGQPVSIDVPGTQHEFKNLLAQAGFAPVRRFTRMLRGEAAAPGEPRMCFAIAGPEFA